MGAFYETISPSLIEWILKQKMFTVATAPLHSKGHVNISPKGGEYFGIIDERTFWYMELTGSGSETVSHLYEPGNGRITVMFMAFEGPPRILRLYGYGKCLEHGTDEYEAFVDQHQVETNPGTRSIIIVNVHQVGTSCGFSVPYYDFKAHRPILNDFFEKKKAKFDAGHEKESMPKYWAYKNAWSNDGLPSYNHALKAAKSDSIAPMGKMVGAYSKPCYTQSSKATFTPGQVILIAMASALLAAIVVLLAPSMESKLILSLPFSFRSTA
ncbi:hypothetical protein AMS68_000884 [Peltaster fructicola]|uniref:Uncharacterized protein n=1 Tax=Peltaster fructicola TaxID=286661 RepID=A0A6H0XKV0_9PEZI|nr:hypothetical protein AMS68_000884 [Peltaster fructicola]